MCRKTFTYEMRTRLAGRSLVKLRDVYMETHSPLCSSDQSLVGCDGEERSMEPK